jgi:hypothetical protein
MNDGRTVAAREKISEAFRDAVEWAENAVNVMNNHATDPKVRRMCELVLGTNNYQNNFNQAKSTYIK